MTIRAGEGRADAWTRGPQLGHDVPVHGGADCGGHSMDYGEQEA